ncbi:helix-turn-helix domain-containing protein [Amycolatopsis sp. FDAARGOS 1241]|uniref:helix-turn-helix domain-containing protein n=1 Tax=Amycolatopsis sp. FDAARGOS 1241 TaxID=2778070 RepID=UPI001951067C|nr:XRE family transcriptional regulator [Amycolatopsis sp. FDAARGOS 1241]QRP50499.1 helix-turn-helix transcriptional regulator [Amycolatopsis sp. FDAARGOS 1241]
MVGSRIRELRAARGLTVTELARRAEVSTGLISQVERELADPSLVTVRKIAKALDVPLFSLFEESETDDVAVVRRHTRMQIQSPGGILYSRISAGRGRLEVLQGTLAPGTASADEPWSHPSEECAVVIAGKLVVEVAATERALDVGDSCYFNSRLPHRYVNPHRKPAEFIISITPPSY